MFPGYVGLCSHNQWVISRPQHSRFREEATVTETCRRWLCSPNEADRVLTELSRL